MTLKQDGGGPGPTQQLLSLLPSMLRWKSYSRSALIYTSETQVAILLIQVAGNEQGGPKSGACKTKLSP